MTEPAEPTIAAFAGMRLIGAADVARTPIRAAVDALETALVQGLAPERQPPRSRLATATGELLVMPATRDGHTGCKLITSTPDNPDRGQPLIQGAFLLFAGPEQRPVALVDGAGLTNLRTPAMSALAVRHLLPPTAAGPLWLTVFGAGPQALGHAEALLASHDVGAVTVVARPGARRDRLVARLAGRSVAVDAREPGSATEAVRGADVICCCTSAATPLFDGALVRADAVVVAIGSHSPRAREVDDTLVARAHVVVESRASTLREAGDVVIPLAAGVLREEELIPLHHLVTGRDRLPDGGPRLYKGTGMPWQDLVVAVEVYRRSRDAATAPAEPG
ncbi:ornithine cyclodeaminase family protein [Micromonospora sp. C28SCA-DRY-2]|uniref:ornithine cyclodeaminase family protein n=1 Tax=Micromonospora sp. C28SCA-DRY-2 TaxID=3059522 RepID=UPI0026749C94|nr:ornithine cyclodeaminase family protein [Micromonospora sp. C28SCA-DRY-2]MDO3703033.1 ornithine cyclodeaminase family protein [Micromonospora sp. C28SCA-DRY-2]